MKAFTIVFFLVQAVLIQNVYSQIIRTAPCGCGISSPVIVQPSVANNLADTLSLLTVSSLLSETLPVCSNVITSVPVQGYPHVLGGCGCRSCGYTVL